MKFFLHFLTFLAMVAWFTMIVVSPAILIWMEPWLALKVFCTAVLFYLFCYTVIKRLENVILFRLNLTKDEQGNIQSSGTTSAQANGGSTNS